MQSILIGPDEYLAVHVCGFVLMSLEDKSFVDWYDGKHSASWAVKYTLQEVQLPYEIFLNKVKYINQNKNKKILQNVKAYSAVIFST